MDTLLLAIGYDPEMFDPWIGKDPEGLAVILAAVTILALAITFARKWDSESR